MVETLNRRTHVARSAGPARREGKGLLRRLGLVLLTLSFTSISWNAVRVGGFEPGQILLALAVAVLSLDALQTRRSPFHVPFGMVMGAGLILLAGLLSAILPVSGAYINSRFVLSTPGVLFGNATLGGDNLTQLGKFEIALIGVILAVLLLSPTIAEARRLAGAWSISALVNAAVAASDASGHTSISAHLLGYIDISGRQAGLTEQANHLAVAMSIVVPVVLFWLLHGRSPIKVAAVLALGLIAYGSLLAGSRGGFVGVLLGAVLFVLLTARVRLGALWFGIPLLLVAAYVAVIAFPSVLSTVAADVRLIGDSGSLSDIGRSLVAQQALLDLQQSPLWGIGFDHLSEAHEVHLQLLAAGGFMALVGYIAYWATVLRRAYVARLVDPALGSALLASVLTFLALNFVENQVADTYLYVPAALLVSLAAMHRQTLPGDALMGRREGDTSHPRRAAGPALRRSVAPRAPNGTLSAWVEVVQP
jgi:hypothetical protein